MTSDLHWYMLIFLIGILFGLIILPFAHTRKDDSIWLYFACWGCVGAGTWPIYLWFVFQDRRTNYYKRPISLSEYRKAWAYYLQNN